MMRKLDFHETIIAYGVLGAVAVSLFAVFITWVFSPTMLNDGQYGMVFILTCPIGWIIGVLKGYAEVKKDQNKPNWDNKGIAGLLVGGFILAAFVGPIAIGFILAPIGFLIGLLG